MARDHPAQTTRLMSCCHKVKLLASLLGPYFEVVNILVQVSPEYAGVAWGALRLIFGVSIHVYLCLDGRDRLISAPTSWALIMVPSCRR
jgi:hypothetical protein